MEEKTVRVDGISCGHCVKTIKRELGELAGVIGVDADPVTKKVVVRWEAPASWEMISATLVELGYPADM